ncbi:MAG: hypothetical protein AAF719_14595 [Pseudomonadota bacterium]
MSDFPAGPPPTGVPAGKVPVLESAAEAWRFARDNWMRFLPAMGILALGFAYYQSEITGWTTTPDWGGLALVGFVYFIASVVAMCAFLRGSTRGEVGDGPGLNFAMDELRYIAVIVGLSLVIGIVGFFVMFLFSIVFVGMAARSGVDFEAIGNDQAAMTEAFIAVMQSGGGLTIGVLGLLIGCLYLWFSVRMSLFLPATIGEQRMMIFQTWSWTKGNFWPILGAVLLTLVPVALIGGIIVGFIEIAIVGDEPYRASALTRFLAYLPNGALTAFTSLLWAGLVGRLYQGLRPRDLPTS